MIIPKKKNEFTVEKIHEVTGKFSTLVELRNNTFKYVPATYGYVEPGHGMRGKKWWLSSEKDLFEMYDIYSGKKEILLWCSKESVPVSLPIMKMSHLISVLKLAMKATWIKWLKLSA